MRSIHRHGLFSQVLLMLGVVGLPPPPTREQLNAEALAETERVKVDLEAAGLSAAEVAEVAEAVGPKRFAKVGRLLLALQKHRRSLGQEPTVGDLLQIVQDIEAGSLGKSIVIDSVTPAYTQGRDIIPERPEEVAQVTFTTSKQITGAMVGKTTFHEGDFTPARVLGAVAAIDLSKQFKQERDCSDATPRPAIKYLLCPGPVYSIRDGQRHVISASRLAVLYGVDMRECTTDPRGHSPDLIRLAPRADGRYTLPATKPSPSRVWAALCSLPREPRTYNRKAQRASKKARTAAKKRRGW